MIQSDKLVLKGGGPYTTGGIAFLVDILSFCAISKKKRQDLKPQPLLRLGMALHGHFTATATTQRN
jgi:hypothetical protein